MVISQRDRAYAHIRQKMLLGEISGGSRLSELGLAKEIGISRTPVRDALNQLGTEGLLEHIPHYGTFVRKLTQADVQELYDLREMLEGYAAERAATRLGRDQLDRLQRLCDQLHELCGFLRRQRLAEFPAPQRKQWIMADVAFHLLVLEGADSPRTTKMVADLKLMTNLCGWRWTEMTHAHAQRYYRTWGSHLRVLRALRRHDEAAARQSMSAHIRKAKKTALEYYDLWEKGNSDISESIEDIVGRIEMSLSGGGR